MKKYLNHKVLAVLSVAAFAGPAMAEDVANAFSTQFNCRKSSRCLHFF